MEAVLTTLIPSLVKENVFGEGEFINLAEDSGSSLGAQFSSIISTVNLTLSKAAGELNIIPLIVKVQTPDEEEDAKDKHVMFHNEVTMYSDVLPALDTSKCLHYPKMYYGLATCGKDPLRDVLILSNLKESGFVLPKKAVFIDYDHISMAMNTIGRFHAMSYTLKHEHPNKFFEIVNKLKIRKEFNSFLEQMGFVGMKRGIEPLLHKGADVDILNKFLKVIKPLNEILIFLNAPNEKFATIVHGDFCNNNVMYKYDESKKPIDCALFDFQGSKYGSPIVDLAFFLYMHTTSQDRDEHWDEYLRIYWESVQKHVHPNTPLPSFEEFLKYFASKAVLGYYPCSFFLPFMAFQGEFLDSENYFLMSQDDKIKFQTTIGGERGQQLLCDIASHLFKNKYIQSFLESYEPLIRH